MTCTFLIKPLQAHLNIAAHSLQDLSSDSEKHFLSALYRCCSKTLRHFQQNIDLKYFSNLHEEFQIDNTVNLLGYRAVLAEHKASGQKMCIVDSGKKPLLTKEDIKSDSLDKKMKDLADKFKYQAISFQEINVTSRGTMKIYGQEVPYAKFEAKSNKLPFSDLAGVVSSVRTSDGSEKLAIAVSEKKRYSQLITDELFKGVTEN